MRAEGSISGDKGIPEVSPAEGPHGAHGSSVGSVDWRVFSDKGMRRGRGASAVERTASPSVASQADSLLSVRRLITGHGK